MIFNKESDFEAALIKILSEKGWEKEVLKNYSEQDLLRNWANILFENNRDIDRLNDYPLTDSEMQQILEQIEALRTPLKLNGFINGKSVSIVRDNPDDKLHFGKEVSLKIYDRREIAAGQSRYQIVQQPKFPTKSKLLNDRRGDLMLLIDGMPVIHIELKKSGIPVSQACNQIEKYSHEGIFSGLFSLVQIFVAMEPNEAVYFAKSDVLRTASLIRIIISIGQILITSRLTNGTRWHLLFYLFLWHISLSAFIRLLMTQTAYLK